jgi:hypothetical protein
VNGSGGVMMSDRLFRFDIGRKPRGAEGKMPKPELEFFPVDNIPWVPVPGAPPGHYQKILTEDPDKMFVTRMLKVDPGGRSTETFVHDFWEEVYIVEGSQWDGDQFFKKGMYACRPPGMKHGPYRTDEGVVTLEVRYMR